MAVPDRFQDNSYVNWVNAGQALISTAEGIYGFCEDQNKNYHLALHQKFPRQQCDGPSQYVTSYRQVFTLYVSKTDFDAVIDHLCIFTRNQPLWHQ